MEERMLYRPEEAAQVLGLSRARLYELMARGEIASIKIGASRRVPLADLQAFVQRLRTETDQLWTTSRLEPALRDTANARGSGGQAHPERRKGEPGCRH